jgi:predicted DNA-binding protein
MTEPTTPLYIRVPYELKLRLEEAARKSGESQNSLVIKAIEKFLKEGDKNTARIPTERR